MFNFGCVIDSWLLDHVYGFLGVGYFNRVVW